MQHGRVLRAVLQGEKKISRECECQFEVDMVMDMHFPSRVRCFTIIDDARTPNSQTGCRDVEALSLLISMTSVALFGT